MASGLPVSTIMVADKIHIGRMRIKYKAAQKGGVDLKHKGRGSAFCAETPEPLVEACNLAAAVENTMLAGPCRM